MKGFRKFSCFSSLALLLQAPRLWSQSNSLDEKRCHTLLVGKGCKSRVFVAPSLVEIEAPGIAVLMLSEKKQKYQVVEGSSF